MRYLLIILFLTPLISKAQTTAIPDPNFELALINLGYDSAPINGTVPTTNISNITSLNVSNSNIISLAGIEDFSSIITLACYDNNLTSLNFSQNSNLSILYCQNNNLNSLDVSQNSNLTILSCGTNSLTSIDVTQNPNLTELNCWQNQLNSLDLTSNPFLTYLNAYENNFTEIDVSMNNQLISISVRDNLLTCLNVKNGNNSNFQTSTGFFAINNANLTCIEVDDPIWANTNWSSGKDSWAIFSSNCNNACSTVGMDELVQIQPNIYPNPTTRNFSIDLGETKTNLTATLSNNLGQVVFSKKYQSTSFIKMEIDAPAGIYFLQLETDIESKAIKILKE